MREETTKIFDELHIIGDSLRLRIGEGFVRTLDLLQASCTLQGAVVIPNEKLAKMRFGEVLKMCLTNNIHFIIRPKPNDDIEELAFLQSREPIKQHLAAEKQERYSYKEWCDLNLCHCITCANAVADGKLPPHAAPPENRAQLTREELNAVFIGEYSEV